MGILIGGIALGSTVSESDDIVLAQSCQSAPTRLVTRGTEPSSTRDAGQQTSEMHLMPTAAVTETVWTLSEPDAATASVSADSEHPIPRSSTDDEAASGVKSPHLTEDETPAAAETAVVKPQMQLLKVARADTDTDDQGSKVTITTDRTDKEKTLLAALNEQLTTDAYEDWSTSTPTTTKVCTALFLPSWIAHG